MRAVFWMSGYQYFIYLSKLARMSQRDTIMVRSWLSAVWIFSYWERFMVALWKRLLVVVLVVT